VSSPGLRLGRAVALAAAGAGALAGCAVDDADGSLDVAVLPRVVLDGTVELSDRSGGRVLIEEVVAHAPRALLQSAVAGDRGDVVVDERAPLLFHYQLSARTGFGADVGGERVWSMPASGGLLSVDFAPSADDVDGVDGLRGHTAIVRGTIAIETTASLASGFGDGADALHGDADVSDADVSDADPDGAPARPGDVSGADVSDADPDGAPAHPGDASDADASDVDVSDADPDGAPAHPGDASDPDASDADVSDADPDGAPAHPGDVSDADVSDADPDGAPAHPGDVSDADVSDADPDGAPAHPGDGVRDADPDGAPARPSTRTAEKTVGGYARAVVRVPFSLVLDGSFERSVILDAEDVGSVGVDEVLPIDLHLAAGELLDGEGLRTLEAVAVDALAHGEQEATVRVSARSTAAVVGVDVKSTIQRPHRPVRSGGSRIDVSGGRFREK
jgi:uncharacterized protein YjbI with pentapeptide repeats